MSDHSRPDRGEFPVGMFFWFIAGIVGLWVAIRNGDPSQIPQEWILFLLIFPVLNIVAFNCGWYFGGMFCEWWASYIFVFFMASILPIALWFIWWAEVGVSKRLPPHPPSGISTIDATTISNVAALLFVVLIVPACYGAYCRQRKA